MAMGILNQIPYASEADAEKWVPEAIETAQALGLKTILLAFFGLRYTPW